MLSLLRRIVQEVGLASDLEGALQLVVRRVREAIAAPSCSIYLLNASAQEYVLMATVGLHQAAVHRVRIEVNQGLIGAIGQREEPLNLKDASIKPYFFSDPQAQAEYFGFLGVPIIHRREVLGVICTQKTEKQAFQEDEEAFLVTLAAQLAGVIAHAMVVGVYPAEGIYPKDEQETACLGGVPAVAGVGIGRTKVIYPLADLEAVPDRPCASIEAEIQRFEEALQSVREDIASLQERLTESLSQDELTLFSAYLHMLDHRGLGLEVNQEISVGQWAEGALRRVIKRQVMHFSAMDDRYLRDRAEDVLDLGQRILFYLQKKMRLPLDYPEHTILIGEKISAADLAEVPIDRLEGLVSYSGSHNSHVAILARALNIPTIMGASGLAVSELEDKAAIIDGYYGHLYIHPSEKLLKDYTLWAKEEDELDIELQSLRDLPAQTPDGQVLSLLLNAGLASDAGLSLTTTADGIGLFRTEISFMARDRFPTETEQRTIYRQLLQAFSPRPVVMRTLDIGGDKPLPYLPFQEENPFLGWRGIRFTLDHPDIFLMQLRAMLSASEGLNNLSIMLPMITSVEEVDESLQLIQRAYAELNAEGLKMSKPKVGVMLEVPAAIYQVEALAKRVDFLSVGSNDLTQYLLAIDRNNARVSDRFDALHPAMLQALQFAVQGAHAQGKPIGLCGEMASDPVSVVLLMGLGFDHLSMNAAILPRMKWVIRSIPHHRAQELIVQAFQLDNAALIRLAVEKVLDNAGLGGLIRAGKR